MPSSDPPHRFPETSWGLVGKAGQPLTPEGKQALATLCELYWYPVYAFVRRYGAPADEARDLTQGFFARLLERNDLVTADQERGRFAALWLRSRARKPELRDVAPAPELDAFEVASLSGGAERAADTVLATLVDRGAVTMHPSHGLVRQEPPKDASPDEASYRRSPTRPADLHPFERTVLKSLSYTEPMAVRDARAAATGAAADLVRLKFIRQSGMRGSCLLAARCQLQMSVVVEELYVLAILRLPLAAWELSV